MRESAIEDCQPRVSGPGTAAISESRLRAQVEALDRRLKKGDQQRRAMLHIMGDLNESNKRLTNHRKAMLHILADYEQDRRRLARQTERLDNSRRALLPHPPGSPQDKPPLGGHPQGPIHHMGDPPGDTAPEQRPDQELPGQPDQSRPS